MPRVQTSKSKGQAKKVRYPKVKKGKKSGY